MIYYFAISLLKIKKIIFFKCHKMTFFLGFVFYYKKLKKEKTYERTKRIYRKDI